MSTSDTNDVHEEANTLVANIPDNHWVSSFERYYRHMPALPEIYIRYQNLSYVVNVSKTQHDINTVATAALRAATFSSMRANRCEFSVLDDLTGEIRPGTTTLIIAPPGHGKTSLLTALAGRLDNAGLQGSLTFNGRTADDTPFNLKNVIAFVEQNDVHLPHLTVRQTFQFALDNLTVDPSILESEELKQAHANRVQSIIDALNLSECSETIVGDELVRGVSGGQRRRTSLGEMLVSNARVLMLDEFSTGLDAATTIEVTRMLQAWAQVSRGSVVTAMLQPPPEVFDMFDDVILLRHGKCVYHGPKAFLPAYLTSLGVPIPTDQDFADFLTEWLSDPKLATLNVMRRQAEDKQLDTITAQRQASRASVGRQASTDNTAEPGAAHGVTALTSRELDVIRLDGQSSVRQDSTGSVSGETLERRRMVSSNSVDKPVVNEAELVAKVESLGLTADKLSQTFHASDLSKKQEAAAKASMKIPSAAPSQFAELQYMQPQVHTFWQSWVHNFRRQVVLMSHEKRLIIPRMFQAILTSLIVGSLFYQLGVEEYTLKLGLFLYVATSLAFSNFAEVPLAAEYKKVLYKQIDAGFYPTTSYLTSLIIVHLPLAFAEVLLLGSIVYWMAGLSDDVGRFFVFLGLLTLMNLAMSTAFRIIAYATPSFEVAQTISGPYASLSLLFGGFLITYDKIPDFLVWSFWISPFSWITRALSINELHSEEYQVRVNGTDKILGDLYLESYEFETDENYIWAAAVFLAVMFVCGMIGGIMALKHIRFSFTRGTQRGNDDDEEALTVQVGTDHQKSAAGAMPFKELTLAFKDIKYTVPIGKGKTRMLLRGVSGYAKPGQMTALMGSSGAGKTTLMDVLAGRKTKGEIEGSITVNGFPKQQETFSRVAGYVEQEDIHLASATVRESLAFSAKLRLPSDVSDEVRAAFVQEVLEMLELELVQNRLIGDNVIPGLSPGELKRVTIGVELVTNPAIIFLDEPTSGLDSRAAATVMRVIRRIASTGRTVVCTIHQPSADLFYMFDNLLLLHTGGYQVFNGPLGYRASELITYMESVPGTPALPATMNPATWMLDVLHGGSGQSGAAEADSGSNVVLVGGKQQPIGERFAQAWTGSSFAKIDNEVVAAAFQHPDGAEDLSFAGKYNAGLAEQFGLVLTRQWIAHWRNPSFSLIRLTVVSVLGIVFGLVYFDLDTSDQPGIMSMLSVIMVVSTFIGIVNNFTGLPVFFKQRALYYRERAANTYSSVVYGVSLGLVEIPWIALNTFTFCCTFYWMVGLRDDAEHFFKFYFAFFLTSMLFAYMGQVFSALLPNAQIAQQLQSGFVSLFFLFAGVFIPEPSIPSGWRWFYTIDPVAHALEALSMPQVECSANDNTCPMIDVPTITGEVKQMRADIFVRDLSGWEFDSYWTEVGYLAIYIAIFIVLTQICLKYVKHITR